MSENHVGPSVAVTDIDGDAYTLDDYGGGRTRWCHGCGDNTVLTALQKLCTEMQLPPERTVFVSGIGCASRFPHYMGTYGFHGVHGRALPVAEGIKIKRPDLNVFVNTGDGDCCSIGAGHWLHAMRYNMNLTVMLHDNRIYGLTKMQASPTSPAGLVTNTTPGGAELQPVNPISVTLGMPNISFVAQAVDWLPGVLYDIIRAGFEHRGTAFISIMQRCPNFLPDHFEGYIRDPSRLLLLTHETALQPDESQLRRFPNRVVHDPLDLDRARQLADTAGRIPVGILYRNPDVPCYEDLHVDNTRISVDARIAALEGEFDKFTVARA